jgi:hypothetical protein
MLSDKTLTCVECRYEFTFTAGEQEFFASRGYTNEPRRCPQCRGAWKSQQRGSRDSTGQAERCTRQFVLNAVGIRWFPSCLEVTSPSTVAIASAQ